MSRFAVGICLFPFFAESLSVSKKSIFIRLATRKHITSVRNYSKESKSEDKMANLDKIVTYEYVVEAIRKADKTLIDVREVDEVKETGQIPTSINIPLSTLSQSFSLSDNAFQQTFNKNKPTELSEIIFYCLSGKRSGMALDFALKNGYANSKNYQGSWSEWSQKQNNKSAY